MKSRLFQDFYLRMRDVPSRFPLPSILAFLFTGASLFLLWWEPKDYFSLKIASVLMLSFFAMVCVGLFTEKENVRPKKKHILSIIPLAAIIVWVFHFPVFFQQKDGFLMSLVLAGAGLFLLVFISPYLCSARRSNDVWHFTYKVSIAILMAVVVGIIIQMGFSLAIVAVDTLLFSIPFKIGKHLHQSVFILVIGLLGPWITLAGIPRTFASQEKNFAYPFLLKVISLYTLPPLIGVYFVILYLYAAKIVLRWNWPEGGVVYFTIAFFITGLVMVFLWHPYRTGALKNILAYGEKLFFLAALPLFYLYFQSIYFRVEDYGITMNRYYVILFGVWFLVVALYMLLWRRHYVRFVFLSASLVLVLSVVGPWSSIRVGQWSQMVRLESILVENNVLVNGKIREGQKKLPSEEKERVHSIILYLRNWGDIRAINPWLDERKMRKFNTMLDETTQYLNPNDLLHLLGISSDMAEVEQRLCDLGNKATLVQGFDYLAPFAVYSYQSEDPEEVIETDEMRVEVDVTSQNRHTIVIKDPNGTLMTDKVDFTPFIETLVKEEGSLTSNWCTRKDDLVLDVSLSGYLVRFDLEELFWLKDDKSTIIVKRLKGNILIRTENQAE